MKRIFLLFIEVFLLNIFLYAQTPQSFQYQAVVRDASGTALVNQSVSFQISIISGTLTGPVEYQETHTGLTNAYGIVTLSIGTGSPVLGTFSSILWGTNQYFVKVEADPTGGTGYLDMGTTQLLSVPYALYSEKSGNIPVYTGGTGIDVTGTTITNTNPDQAVTLTGTGATSVIGTYPDFIINSIDNNTIYTGGTGIDVTGTTITNTSPDQAVTLTGTGATSVTGTYPNFTINSTDNNTTYTAGSGLSLTGTIFANTAPDQSVTMTSGTGISITGSYPSFTVTNLSPNATHTGDVTGATALTIVNGAVTAAKLNSMSASNGQVLKFNGSNWAPSTDLNSGTPGGVNKTVQFNNSGAFGGDTALIWDNVNKRLGVGLTNPSGRMVIQGSATALASDPLFEIKNAAGQQIMAVYNDSIHFFISDIGSNQGGFAVSGRNNAKAFTNNFLVVTPDSTRIFTGDTISGFGVENLGIGSSTSYMHLTPNNYFIGHQAGDSVSTGMYNSFFGYKSGISTTTGSYNVLSGFRSGFLNKVGSFNTFLGHESGFNNLGSDNTFIGYEAGESHTTGGGNVYIGSKAGQQAFDGSQNVFIGENSGFSNNGGSKNIFIGYSSGKNNLTGNFNVLLGYECGLMNTTGGYNTMLGFMCGRANTIGTGNIFLGFMAGYNNIDGGQNILIGYNAGFSNTSGSSNTILGNSAGLANTTGYSNVFIGETSGKLNTIGTSNVFVGVESGYNNTTAGEGVFIGRQSGYSNQTGYANICIGSSAGHDNIAGNSNLFLGAMSGWKSLSGYNVCLGEMTNAYNINGNHNVSIGFQSGINSTGSGNVLIGSESGYDLVGSNKLIIENSPDITNPLIFGDFINNRVAFNKAPLNYPFQIGTNPGDGNGAYLTGGGVWTAGSSRSFKDRFVSLDGNVILDKIAGMELKGWYYKGTEEYHIGPFAEDFFNAFGTGVLNVKEDLGKYLSATDVSGVSIVAIKELVKQNAELKKQLEVLKSENNEIKNKIIEIEKLQQSYLNKK